MCLAIPGKVVAVLEGNRAAVDFGGTRREVDTTFVRPEVGQYVLVHAGFAMQVLDEEDAKETLALWDEALAAMAGDEGDAPVA